MPAPVALAAGAVMVVVMVVVSSGGGIGDCDKYPAVCNRPPIMNVAPARVRKLWSCEPTLNVPGAINEADTVAVTALEPPPISAAARPRIQMRVFLVMGSPYGIA